MLNSQIQKNNPECSGVKSRLLSGKKILTVVTLISFFSAGAQTLTPTVVASSGGFFSNPSGMLSEAVAELAAVTTLTSTNNFLTQGFQQPSADFSTTVEPIVSEDFSLSVFPNPSEGIFNLVIHSDADETFRLSVYDIIGKKIISAENFLSRGKNIFRLDLSNRIAGIYLLECLFTNSQNGKQTKTHIKLNLSY